MELNVWRGKGVSGVKLNDKHFIATSCSAGKKREAFCFVPDNKSRGKQGKMQIRGRGGKEENRDRKSQK